MRALGKAGLVITVTVAAASTLFASPAAAHVHQTAGNFEVTFGWRDEPAFTGAANAITLEISDLNGVPVAGAGTSLTVEVSVGDDRTQLPLEPTDESGLFTAAIIPTRAGTYGLHITGTIQGQSLDVSSTCSEQTFACVQDPTVAQFPTKEPTPDQLADRVDREAGRVDAARSSASSAQTLATVAIVMSALTLGAALALGIRRGRKIS